jgi:hypothetical protein
MKRHEKSGLRLTALLGLLWTSILHAQGWPDLLIEDFWEEDHRVHFRIQNKGQVPAAAGHVAGLSLDGQDLDTYTVTQPLSPGKSFNGTFAKFYWQCKEDGAYTLRVEADITDTIKESNEKNNRLTETWICDTTPIQQPDLIIEDIGLSGQVIVFVVKNIGKGAAPAGHAAELRVDGAYAATEVVSKSLDPGESAKLTFANYLWQCQQPQHAVRVTADQKNTVAESDETNNTLTEAWTCDVYPPMILTGPTASEITATSAVISWTTDEDCDSKVYYDTNPGSLSHQWADAQAVRDHRVTLTDLSPGVTVYYRVESTDAWDNTVLSDRYSFVTDFILPDLIVSSVWRVGSAVWYRVENQGEATAPAGHTARLTVNGLGADTHRLSVPLPPGTGAKGRFPHYAFQCVGEITTMQVSADIATEVAESDETNNSRPAIWLCEEPLRITAGPRIAHTTLHSATLVWTTNRPATGVVDYDTAASLFGMQASQAALSEEHQITLEGLLPGVLYQYRVTSTDMHQDAVTSPPAFFQTEAPSKHMPPWVADLRFERKDGPDPQYRIIAEAGDDEEVTHVIFYLDGKPFHTDYSPPFEAVVAPGLIGTSRADFFQKHDMAAVAVDAGMRVSERFPGLFEPAHECADITAHFVFPYPPEVIYVPRTPVPPGTTYPLTVYGVKVERTWTSAPHTGLDDTPDFLLRETESPLQEMRYYANSVAIGTIPPDPADPWFNHRYTLEWNLDGYRAGDYHLRFDAVGDADCIQTLEWDTRIEVGEPSLTCERRFWREGHTFWIELAIRNHGTVSYRCDQVRDNVDGLQPIHAVDGDTTVSSLATADGREHEVRIHVGGAGTHEIPPGRSLVVAYRAVPVHLHSPAADHYRIGEERVTVHGLSAAERWSFDLPGTVTEDGERLSVALDRAIAAADYLIVTNPERAQLFFGSADDLLSKMAEFAYERSGVLGYLSGPAWDDPVWIRDCIRMWGTTMRGADGVEGHFNDNGFLLLVGESEILPGWAVDIPDIHWNDGYTTAEVGLADLPYADVISADNVPELNLGRLVGDTGGALIAALQAGLDARAAFDRSYGLATSGAEGEWEDFVTSAQAIYNTWRTEAAAGKAMADAQRMAHWTAYVQKEQLVSGFAFPKESADTVLVADLDGSGPAVIRLEPDRRLASVFAHGDLGLIRSTPTWTFACPFDAHDGAAAGDIDGDGLDELVIMSLADDKLIIAYDPPHSLAHVGYEELAGAFDAGDVIVCGHVRGDARDEIVVARTDDSGTVDIYEYDNTGPTVAFGRTARLEGIPFRDGDGFQVADMDTTHAAHEIVVTRQGENRVFFYTAGGTSIADLPCDPVTAHDALICGDWDGDGSDELGLLIDDEVDDKRRLKLFQNDCWILNAAGVWDIKRHHSATLYSRFLNFNGVLSTGTSRSDAVSSGDIDGDGKDEIVVAHQGHGRLYVLDGHHSQGWKDRYLPVVGGMEDDIDIFTLRGHGNPTGCSPFDTGDIAGFTFSSRPLVLGLTCLSGNYEGRWSWLDANGVPEVHGPDDAGFAEAFFESGAAAYIGSTHVSTSSQNHAAGMAFFDEWGTDETAAQALTQFKRNRVGDDDHWRYWCTEYNFYGDAKFGRTDGAAGIMSLLAAAAGQADQKPQWHYDANEGILDVHIPDYEITASDVGTALRIPGGDLLIQAGRPQVPLVRITLDLGPEAGAPVIELLSKTGLHTEKGPVLPIANLAPSLATYTGGPSPAMAGWFPARDFDWYTIDNGLQGTRVVLSLYPLLYDSLSQEIRFHTDYRLRLQVPLSPVTLRSVATDRNRYQRGETVQINGRLFGEPHTEAPILAVTIKRYGTDEVLDGLWLRRLEDLVGEASLQLSWESLNVSPGTCYAELTLSDFDGTLWQRKSTLFEVTE